MVAADDSSVRSPGVLAPEIFAAEVISALKALVGIRVAPLDRRVSDLFDEVNIRGSAAVLCVRSRRAESEARDAGLFMPPVKRSRFLARPTPAMPSVLRETDSFLEFSSREAVLDSGARAGFSTCTEEEAICDSVVERRGVIVTDVGLEMLGSV